LNCLKMLHAKIMKCQKCPLSQLRTKAVPGEGSIGAKIMFIGQAPGREEDKTGRPFVGRAGKFLDELFQANGISREEVFLTGSVKCFPPDNRVPKREELLACKPYLIEQIVLVNPRMVVFLGNVAQKFLLNEEILKGRIIFFTYHPAAGMRFPKIKEKMAEDFNRLVDIAQENRLLKSF